MRGSAKVLTCIAAVLLCLSTARAAPTAIDGDISDWNVTLTTSSSWAFTTFDQDSFIPNPEGAISYVYEDYLGGPQARPRGGEPADVEALYLDHDPNNLYVGVISSHLWDCPISEGGESQIHVTVEVGGALAAEYYQRGGQHGDPATDFNVFAEADLGVDERYLTTWYPNYFWEGSIAYSLPLFQPWTVSVWVSQWCDNDSLFVDQSGGGTPFIPEPASALLVGIGVLVAGGGSWFRKKTRAASR